MPQITLTSNEKRRRLIVNLIFVVYWLVIFEGAIRKWLLPQYATQLLLLRDAVVLVVYYYVFRYRMWGKPSRLFQLGIILALILAPWAILQWILLKLPPLVILYGWKMYCLYIPLPFIIERQFRGADLARLFRQSLKVTIPIAVLVILQWRSPISAPINKTVVEDAHIFVVDSEHVRPQGTFSFPAGQGLFIMTTTAMLLIIWLLPTKLRPLNRLWFWICTGTVVICFSVNGNRAPFVALIFTIIAVIAHSFLDPRKNPARLRLTLGTLAFVLVGGLINVFVFSDVSASMVRRHGGAEANGPFIQRIFSGLTSCFSTARRVPFYGSGMGLGSPMARISMTETRIGDEDDFARTVVELGIIGWLAVAYRIYLLVYLLTRGIASSKSGNNPVALVLWTCTAPIFMGNLMQATNSGYGWLFVGFSLAANKLQLRIQRTDRPASK